MSLATLNINSLVEGVVFGAVSRPGRSVSKAPQEADVGAGSDPTSQRNSLVEQHGRLMEQPVELHRSLKQQREHVGGEGGPAPKHDHNNIIPASKTKKMSW